MGLKQPNKTRVDLDNTERGDWDDDGYRLILYNGSLYTGYVVLDRFADNSVENEIEYKNGSHVGWDNEYNINGNLIYSCLTVGETSLEIYKYDSGGALIETWRSVEDEYYYQMVNEYNLD
jgi:hypothetical protein